MIRHTVAFTLKHPHGSEEERKFLADALVLADLAMVENFEQFRQISPKSSFDFGFSMGFKDDAAYQAYNEHPVHEKFVRERWLVEVNDFKEIDYIPL